MFDFEIEEVVDVTEGVGGAAAGKAGAGGGAKGKGRKTKGHVTHADESEDGSSDAEFGVGAAAAAGPHLARPSRAAKAKVGSRGQHSQMCVQWPDGSVVGKTYSSTARPVQNLNTCSSVHDLGGCF